jgi:hypothetical protein
MTKHLQVHMMKLVQVMGLQEQGMCYNFVVLYKLLQTNYFLVLQQRMLLVVQ